MLCEFAVAPMRSHWRPLSSLLEPLWPQMKIRLKVIRHRIRPSASLESKDPRFDKLISSNAKMEKLGEGFEWCEGPVWNKEGGYLLFSDIPRNSLMKWKDGEGVTLLMKPSGYTGITPYPKGKEPGSNANTFDSHGRLTQCEHGDRRISVLTKDGGKRTLADNYQGKRLNSPNDLVFRSNGDLYFTDPPYGLPQQATDPRRKWIFAVYSC